MATVNALFSVNWNGQDLNGVKALEQLRASLPALPITHFVSGAYFCRGGQNTKTAEQMAPAFATSDELAVLIAPWASIHGSLAAEKAPEQTKPPRPFQVNYPGITEQQDAGGTNWLSGYPHYDIEAFVAMANRSLTELLDTLAGLGTVLAPPVGYRAAGWAANDTVLKAFSLTPGVLYEASAANAVQCEEAVKDTSLRADTSHDLSSVLKNLAKLWGTPVDSPDYLTNKTLSTATGDQGTNWDTRPMILQPHGGQPLLEIPNLCMTPPYCAPSVTRAFVERCAAGPASEVFYISIAVDQETAEQDLPKLQPVLERLVQTSGVRFITHAAAAAALSSASIQA